MITNRLHAGLDSIESPKEQISGQDKCHRGTCREDQGFNLETLQKQRVRRSISDVIEDKGGADRNSDSLRLPDEVTSVECGPML